MRLAAFGLLTSFCPFVAVAALPACSEPFRGCEDTQTCPTNVAGSGGQAGAGTGGSTSSGGSAGAGATGGSIGGQGGSAGEPSGGAGGDGGTSFGGSSGDGGTSGGGSSGSAGAAGAGPEFPSITGLVGRFEASGANLTLDVDKVTEWRSISSGGSNLKVTELKFAPTWEPRGWNGTQGSVLFKSADTTFLTATSGSIVSAADGKNAPWTVVAVMQRAGSAVYNQSRVLFGWFSGTTSALNYARYTANTDESIILFGVWSRGNTGATALVNWNTSWDLGLHIVVFRRRATQISFRLDGKNLNSADASAPELATHDQFILGGRTLTAANNFSDVRLAELAVYKGELADVELSRLEEYFRARWEGLPDAP